MGVEMTDQERIDSFHKLYIEMGKETWLNTKYRGVPVSKCPLDLWVYQEIIFECKPDTIIETGSLHGGSALWMADQLDFMSRNGGIVYSIDIFPLDKRPQNNNVVYITGNSADPATLKKFMVTPDMWAYSDIMVVLDSDHSKAHVLKEMDLYGPLVSPGQYMIVEDGNINGHPVLEGWGDGPAEALAEWLPLHPEFWVDKSREKHMMTFNPGGYLRRR
jgi:cephalosporin hydroxylase